MVSSSSVFTGLSEKVLLANITGISEATEVESAWSLLKIPASLIVTESPVYSKARHGSYRPPPRTQNQKKNHALREESKIAASKYLYKNLNALKEFEKFLEEAYIAAQSGNKLKNGYTVKFG